MQYQKVAILPIGGGIKGGPEMTFNLDITSFHFKVFTWQGRLERQISKAYW